MNSPRIVEELIKYHKEKNSLFCTPGHNGGRGFLEDKIGREFLKLGLSLDITEVDMLDNYHNATGIIKKAQEDLKRLYKSYKSYFLINGSTSGNLAMIFAAFKEGDRVLIERNCHKSIFNGIVLRKLNPIYIKNRIDERLNGAISVDTDYFIDKIENTRDIKGIIVTYPNYYGVCCNLKKIMEIARKKGIYVLVDGAHGAHFTINENLPKDAVEIGCDIVVQSAHKTLPSLTQGAYLHVNNKELKEKIEEYILMFNSTSPSYLLMASLDYGRYYLETYGKEDYNKLLALSLEYKSKIEAMDTYKVLSKDILEFGEDIDNSRLVVIANKDINMADIAKSLRKKNIQYEMQDKNSITFILTPFQKREDFERLYEELYLHNKISSNIGLKKTKPSVESPIPKMELLPYKIQDVEREKIDFRKSKDRIIADSIIPYPPGVPLIAPGEVMNEDIIEKISFYINSDVDIIGISDKIITVVK